MYKVGDEVFVKARVDDVRDGYVRVYAQGYGAHNFHENFAVLETNPYERGLADAWNLAKKIVMGVEDGGFDSKEVIDVFGKNRYYSFKDLTAEEALAKIEAYEKEKEIKVGDVVTRFEGDDAVVVHVQGNGINLLHRNGLVSVMVSAENCKKTGKHIDIEGLLRQIGE